MCQLKGMKDKLSVAYIFGREKRVHLFYLSHFLCPPPQFIWTGPRDIRLGCSTNIFKQGLLREGGSAPLNSVASSP